MPLVPAKCTQCGANLQVNSDNECSICSACGTPFITEKAIINYNTTVNNTVNNTYNVDSKTIVSGNNEVHIHNDELNRLFLIEGGELTEYKGNRSEITIPEGVIGIGKNFSENKNSKDIEKVTLPASLKYINGHLHYCKTVTFNENCSDINIAPGALGGYIQIIENLPLTIQNFSGDIFSEIRQPLIICKYSKEDFLRAYGEEGLFCTYRVQSICEGYGAERYSRQRLLICFEFEKFVTTPDGFKIAKGKKDAVIYDVDRTKYNQSKTSPSEFLTVKMPSYCEGVPITYYGENAAITPFPQHYTGHPFSGTIYLPEKLEAIPSLYRTSMSENTITVYIPSCVKWIGSNSLGSTILKFKNDYSEIERVETNGILTNCNNEIYAPNLKHVGQTTSYTHPCNGKFYGPANFTSRTPEERQAEKEEKQRQAEKYESEKEPLALVSVYKKELNVYAEKNNVKKLLTTVKKGDKVTVKVHPSETIYISDGVKQEVLPKGAKICNIGGFLSVWGIKCK